MHINGESKTMFEVILDPPRALTDEIFAQLEAHNDGLFAEKGFESDVAVVARNDGGDVIAGAYGRLSWGYLYVDSLWLAASERGSGNGRKLLAAIEAAAVAHGYHRAYLWTTSFQALDFYKRCGYQVFGELPERPPGHITYFLHKQRL